MGALLAGCSSLVENRLNPATYYYHDIKMQIEGLGTHKGMAVVPKKDSYKVKVWGYGDIDHFTLRTCHREIKIADPAVDWWNKGYEFEFKKTTIEKEGVCPVELGLFNHEGQHGFGLIDFKMTGEDLNAKINCNGEEVEFEGTYICQARAGLIQEISFPEEVIYEASNPGCDAFSFKGEGTFKSARFSVARGHCVYYFGGIESDKILRLMTYGYDRIAIRPYELDFEEKEPSKSRKPRSRRR